MPILNACLGGFFAQHPELAHRPKDELKTKLSDAARTYIRQQIVNFANVLDVASSFLLLDKRFAKTPDQIEKDFAKDEASANFPLLGSPEGKKKPRTPRSDDDDCFIGRATEASCMHPTNVVKPVCGGDNRASL